MKKYLLILTVVLVFSSVVSAASVNLQIIAGAKPGYLPGDTITIALVASGFGTGLFETIGALTIASATTDNGGTASNPDLNIYLKDDGYHIGSIVNSGGILITSVIGITPFFPFEYPSGNLWWFDYHIPDVPASTIIAIDLTGLVIRDDFGGTMSVTYGGALEIHVAEPPCCPGDIGNVGDIDVQNYTTIKQQLSMAAFFNNGVPYIAPGDPNTGFLWDPCMDCEPWGVGDGDVDVADYTTIKQKLSMAAFFNNGVPYIAPDDPNTGFLWPCN